jgi:hypothetical protein
VTVLRVAGGPTLSLTYKYLIRLLSTAVLSPEPHRSDAHHITRCLHTHLVRQHRAQIDSVIFAPKCLLIQRTPLSGIILSGARGQWEHSVGLGKETGCPLCRLIGLAVYKGQHDTSNLLDENITIGLEGPQGMDRTPVIVVAGLWRRTTTIRFVNKATFSDIILADSQMDVTRARGWISACENNHGDTCNPRWSLSSVAAIPGLEVLRLIDVVSECLMEARGPFRYLTLSYVWGGVNNVRLTSNKKNSLMEKGVFRTIWHLLPRTIKDVIEVVRALGERFLWVDALCLVQNDAVVMQNGVEMMDLIYGRAALCLIAASGDSANAGLPGARLGNRFVMSHVEQILPGIQLVVYNELDHVLRSSTYNRRGWA